MFNLTFNILLIFIYSFVKFVKTYTHCLPYEISDKFRPSNPFQVTEKICCKALQPSSLPTQP